MKSPPLGLGEEDITWPDQVAPAVERRLVPETSNLKPQTFPHQSRTGPAAQRRARLSGYSGPDVSASTYASPRPHHDSVTLSAGWTCRVKWCTLSCPP